MKKTVESIKKQAQEELKEEAYREAVEIYKTKLKNRKWYKKLFPWRIVIIKKEY